MPKPRAGAGGLVISTALAALLYGCAAAEPPRENVAQAQLAVESAGQTNATELAALELRQARDKLEQARQAMEAEDYDRARRLAEEARVDAQLAEAKAQAVSTARAAEELQEGIRALQRETQRGETQGVEPAFPENGTGQ